MIREANKATIEQLLHRRTDLSTFVVHFTRSAQDMSALDNLRSILSGRKLEARNVYGMAQELTTEFPQWKAHSVSCASRRHHWNMRG